MSEWLSDCCHCSSLESTGASSVSTHDPAPSSGLLDELLGRLPTVMNRKFVDEVSPLAQVYTT